MKGFLYFLLGAGIGAGTAYFVTRKIYIKRNDEEIDKLEKYYEDKIPKRSSAKLKKAVKVSKTDEKPSEEALKLEEKKHFVETAISPVKGPIEDYAAKYKIVEENGAKLHIEEGIENDPRTKEICQMVIISDVEWEEDDEYEKHEITYFAQEEFFADEQMNVIDNLTVDDVGRSNLEHFGITGEEGVLYVRSTDAMIDYRINLEEGSYYEVLE